MTSLFAPNLTFKINGTNIRHHPWKCFLLNVLIQFVNMSLQWYYLLPVGLNLAWCDLFNQDRGLVLSSLQYTSASTSAFSKSFKPSAALMKPSCKPLDVQTKQMALYRQKPAPTSKQLHTGQLIHLIEALGPRERKKRISSLEQFDGECTYIKSKEQKITRLHSREHL